MTDIDRNPARIVVVGALAVIVLAAVAVAGVYLLTGDDTPPTIPPPTRPAAVAEPVATTAPPPVEDRLRVSDLMDRAGCTGEVIGTQLYSYETGRCTLGEAEVTIAVFDTAELRDQWIEVGRSFGGSFVAGQGWAAGVDTPDGAAALAGALDGQQV